MKEISLTKGQITIVDDSDFDFLNQWKWFAIFDGSNYYAARTDWDNYPKSKTIRMHRVLLGITDSKDQGDHKDHNTLNNQRNNLRKCTPKQNGTNKSKRKAASSKFKGVSWHKRINKWHSQIAAGGKKLSLGYSDDEKTAAIRYNEAALRLHGEFAHINMIQCD
jgi:hypothetical protein